MTIAPAASAESPRPRVAIDFLNPPGEPALIASDSVTWRVFKNPIATYIGGIAAVILELGEPRVRAGVWDHSTFRTDPLRRLRRTGLAAMVTVYGPGSTARAMIAGVRRMHDGVQGVSDTDRPYHANDPELLNWVQATASFGFVEAYSAFVRPLSRHDFDRFYAESVPSARLYGAVGMPQSQEDLDLQFAAMRPKLEPSPIVVDFLRTMETTPVFPRALRPLQRLLVRAGVSVAPGWAREVLGLGAEWDLKPWQAWLVRHAGKVMDRIPLPGSPAVQACRRLGLPGRHLYR